jgi:hypothetical protein
MKKRNEYNSFQQVSHYIIEESGKKHLEPDDFESQLQSGDIVLFSGKDGISADIKIWMPYRKVLWSHVGLIIKFKNPDFYTTLENSDKPRLKNPHCFLVESIGSGVRILPLELALKNYEHCKPYSGNIIAMRNNALNIEKEIDISTLHARQQIIQDFVLFYQNTPFDTRDFLKMTFRVLLLRVKFLKTLFWKRYYFRKRPPFICTELVFNAFKEAGIEIPHTPGIISPEDYWYDENNTPVGVLK